MSLPSSRITVLPSNASSNRLQPRHMTFVDTARRRAVLSAQVGRGSSGNTVMSTISHKLGVGRRDMSGAHVFPRHHKI